MTFKEIIERWRALPGYSDDGKPIRASVKMRDFIRTLTTSDERGWFKACHAWYKGGPSPDGDKRIDDILNCLTLFHRNMAQAHLDCARLVGCPCDESFVRDIKFVAEQRDLPESFLLELVNEIRCGQPRQPVASPVYVTYPLVWKEKQTGVLARFVLEKLSGDERPPGSEGRVFPAPAQAFFIEMDKQFKRSFATALDSVRESFDIATTAVVGSNSVEDVRVSIELLGEGTLPAFFSLEGPSAGAALDVGVAKCLAGDVEVNRERADGHNVPLRNLDLKIVAISAGVTPEGRLHSVGGIALKALEILRTREAQSHEINVLVVAEDQSDLVKLMGAIPKTKCFLWPASSSTVKEFTSGAEWRAPESLLVIRAADLRDIVETLRELQANTLLSVLEKPFIIGAYLLAGSRGFPPALVALMFAGWYFLPGFWFVLIGVSLVAAGIFFVRSKIRKIKRRAELCLLPRSTAYSHATWANMVATLEAHHSDQSFKNICSWCKRLLVKNSDEQLTLKVLPWLWYRSTSFWLRLLILAVPLALMSTPLQYCLAENLFPGTANILRGESRRGDGNNVRYAAFQSKCESGACLGRATIGSYGLMRLFLEHKPRASRFLRITRVDAMSYVKVDDDSPGSDQITIPVINDEAKFYYGIDENTPWEIELDIEVICYCGRSLRKARLTGNRAPPGE